MTDVSNQQSPISSVEHRSEDILIDKHRKTIDKDVGLRMFQIADRRLLMSDRVQPQERSIPSFVRSGLFALLLPFISSQSGSPGLL